MIVIVTGCRDWMNVDAVEAACETVALHEESRLFHGDCDRGADRIAAALTCWEHVHAFPAQWDRHGSAAGPMRNRQMCQVAAAHREGAVCLAFWDGKSPGTRNCIEEATKASIPVRIYPKGAR